MSLLLALPLPLQLGLLFGASELALVLLRRAGAASDRRDDRATLRTIWLTLLAAFPLGGLVAARTPALTLPDSPTLALAVLVFATGFALRWTSIVVLGRFFTVQVAIRDGHTLVTRGPYARLRHPSYAGLLLVVAGVALAYQHVLSFALIVPLAAWAVARRVRVEERALADAFGDAWRVYAARTARLVPGLY